jgi:hypothetical protein
MLPGEAKLVARMKDRPFALLGIDTDKSLEDLRRIMKENEITWRNVWCDPKDVNTLPRRWNIRGYPTMLLIDHEGVIRKRMLGVDEKEFEADVERMTAAAEAASKKG